MNPWLAWFLLLGLVGLLGFVVSIRDMFKRYEERDEPTDWRANKWLTDKNWLCYGERK